MNAQAPVERSAAERDSRRGLAAGLVAYALWGVLPIYFKAVAAVPAIDIVAHRVMWSVPFLALLLTATRGWGHVATALGHRRTLRLLTATSLLIAINWLLYVYAVVSGHILAGSLGYYLNPLANVLLGRFILKEHLSRLQWAAVAIAAAGIAALLGGALGQLWISLILCFSFATYGLLRKIAAVEAVPGLAIETGLLLPLAAGWLAWGFASGQPVLGTSGGQTALLLLSGVVTMVPLLLFTAAARRLPYSTLGMLQFVAPTLQFLLAVLLYGEPFTWRHAIAFGAIWCALALYVTALVRARQDRYRKPGPELCE
jgi:chloramphenicol-sensitive protein RarD